MLALVNKDLVVAPGLLAAYMVGAVIAVRRIPLKAAVLPIVSILLANVRFTPLAVGLPLLEARFCHILALVILAEAAGSVL